MSHLVILLFGLNIAKAQEVYIINKLNFNTTKDNEIAPVFYKNGLVFCSNRANPFMNNYKDTARQRLYNIYLVKQRDSIKWGLAKIFSKEITTGFNEGPLCFTNNYKTIFFTRNINVDEQEGNTYFKNNKIGIFVSNCIDGKWTEPVLWENCNKNYNTAHPCISADGKQLFFISDMPGGFGKTDIYTSVLVNGKWTKPQNLGKQINSPENEYFPFYNESGRLYFSSNRAKGMGGFDIYYSNKKNDTWSKPILLSKPLNSVHNDFSFICDSTQEYGYFASDRDESDDIYSFKMNWPLFDKCDSLKINNYCYTFYEAGNYDLDTMPLRYEWDIAGLAKIKGLEADYCFEGEGMYKIALNIIDTLTEDVFYNQATYDFVIEDIEQVYPELPDTFATNKNVEMDGSRTNLKNFEIHEYYWDFGDGSKAVGVKTKHKYPNEGKYTVMLGVKGINANGSMQTRCTIKDIVILDNYTKQDSSQITQTIITEKSEKLQTKSGFKESNKTNDIVEDKIYKVELARSEEKMSIEDEYFDAIRNLYTIMENYLTKDSMYSYTVGNEQNITNTYPIYMTVKKAGYMQAKVKSFDIIPDSITVNDSLAMMLLNKLLAQWKSIHFEYGKYEIQPESYEMLDKVYNVLNKYNTLKIEIAAHTDDIGTTGFNKELSDKRANAVMQYLINKGIDRGRLVPKGYGKSKPLVKGNTEEARKENRRVEFIVIETGM